MIFSGGEPLLRDDIFELIGHARESGIRPVLGTNGILITLTVAERLKRAGLAVAGISVDSIEPARHDYFRQSIGAWRRTMAGIKACREVGLPFQLHTTVTSWNEQEITAITDLAVQLGAIAHHIFFLVPTGRGEKLEYATLRTEQYERLLTRILDKQAQVAIEIKPTCAPQFMRLAKQRQLNLRFSRGCLAGTAYCVVLPNGDVQPCAYLPIKVGNVREMDFATLWHEATVFQQLRNSQLKGGCGRCNYTDICGGCRARAFFYANGDYLAEEPWCRYAQERQHN
jgi:putative heme d1 biosynthesis radical SAM protein NirJ2